VPIDTRAWLLDLGDGWRAAVGAYPMVEYVLAPAIRPIPLSPAHCPGLMVWREQLIPVLDPARLMGLTPDTGGKALRAVILAWQRVAGEALHHGALLVRSAPVEIAVSDDLACPLPDRPEILRTIALSCFTHEDRAVPVLNVVRLFGERLAGEALAEAPAEERVGARADGSPGFGFVRDDVKLRALRVV